MFKHILSMFVLLSLKLKSEVKLFGNVLVIGLLYDMKKSQIL